MKIFLSFSLINKQNLIAVSYTLCVVGPKNLVGERRSPAPWDGGVSDPIEIRHSITCVIMPNLVVKPYSVSSGCGLSLEVSGTGA